MEQLTCKQCAHCYVLTKGIDRGISISYTTVYHCMRKEKDLTNITQGCFYYHERKKEIDDIPHNPKAKSTGLFDYKGNELFEDDYIMIPHSMLERQRVAKIVWDRQYKCWATQDQEPFNRRTIGLSAYIVNILPWITSAGYKVTEKRIIDLYK